MGKAVDRVAEEFSAFDVTVSVRLHAREFCHLVRSPSSVVRCPKGIDHGA